MSNDLHNNVELLVTMIRSNNESIDLLKKQNEELKGMLLEALKMKDEVLVRGDDFEVQRKRKPDSWIINKDKVVGWLKDHGIDKSQYENVTVSKTKLRKLIKKYSITDGVEVVPQGETIIIKTNIDNKFDLSDISI